MSLIKSFNTSYLKENLKKSKGIITLLIILVPLFTIINTIVNVNGTEEYVNIPDKEWISSVNAYGMYIIPIVLSFLLFGYVFKKNSVDLINSMPINRKSIFVTNTVIGIVIITVIQVLTAISLYMCDYFLEYTYIYLGMIIDLFVLMWVSYIFVFTATNLAMTFSGTFPTQILLTILILFLVPFLIDCYNDFYNFKEYEIVIGDSSFINLIKNEESYSMPYRNLKYNYQVSHEYDYDFNYEMYNTKSIIKMASLSVIYAVIGTYFFSRRKMENCEEAFSKDSTHIFVKALTILPIMIVLMGNGENSKIVLNLSLIVFYYFIYDFIVKSKIGIKTSVIGLIVTVGVVYGVCMGVNYIKTNAEMPKIKVEDVTEIAIGSESYYDAYRYFNILDIASDTEYFIKNKELIDTVFGSAADIDMQNKIYQEEFELYSNNEIDYINTYVEPTRSINVTFKTIDGKKHKAYLSVSESNYENITRILENDVEYKSKILAELEMNTNMVLNGKILDEDIENIIKNEIKNKINSINTEDMLYRGDLGYVSKYYYNNHKLVYNDMCLETTPEILTICANEINKESIKKLKKIIENNENKSFFIDLSNEPMWWGINHKYFHFQKIKEDVAKLVIQEQDFNSQESFYQITGESENVGGLTFFTNNVDEVDRLIQLELERNYEYYWQEEYELQKYYRSDWLYQNYYFGESNEEIYQDDMSYEYEEDFYEEETNTVENETVEENYIEEDMYIEPETNMVEGNYVENEVYIEENIVENTVLNEIYTNEVVYENIV